MGFRMGYLDNHFYQVAMDERDTLVGIQMSKKQEAKNSDELRAEAFEIFGYIEPRENFEPMEAETVYVVGEKDFDGCTIALYRKKAVQLNPWLEILSPVNIEPACIRAGCQNKRSKGRNICQECYLKEQRERMRDKKRKTKGEK